MASAARTMWGARRAGSSSSASASRSSKSGGSSSSNGSSPSSGGSSIPTRASALGLVGVLVSRRSTLHGGQGSRGQAGWATSSGPIDTTGGGTSRSRRMDHNPLVGRLTRLGLTSYEARAYAALIKRESFTPAQVARESGVPRQRIYDVLGTLVQKGLASARPGASVKYAAIGPDHGCGAAARRAARGPREPRTRRRGGDRRTDARLRGRPVAHEPARVHRGAARPRGDQSPVRRAPGARSSARSWSSRSRRSRGLRRRT